MKGSLVIFAKDSKLSKVKTRLAGQANVNFAREFYQHSLEAIFETANQTKKNSQVPISLYCALPEKKSIQNPKWQNFSLMPVWTTSEHLAPSLNHIYDFFINQSDFVILIGSDSPQISSDDLLGVINKILKIQSDGGSDCSRCLIGPSLDGGFYLFASQAKIPSEVWLNISYSKTNTLSQLIESLSEHHLNVELLKEEIDIDTLEDIKTLITALETNQNLNAAQKKLINWLESNASNWLKI